MTGRIVVVGGLNMDIHLFGVRASGGQAPLLADHHLAQPGGKGANVARAIARLGCPVTLVGRVGDDEFGHDCVAAVAADGVDTGGVFTTGGASTGFVAIELERGRHRSLVFSEGANEHLEWADVEPHVADLGSDDLVVVQAEVPRATLSALCARLHDRGVSLYLDPTPPERVDHDHLRAAEVITPSVGEAAQLTGRTDGSPLWHAFAARELVEAGVRRAVVKTAERGALVATDRRVVRIATLAVDVHDETGAGDAFLAALAVRRHEGADWETAIRFANAASALSVSRMGLVLPRRAEVDEAAARIDPTVEVVLDDGPAAP